MKRFTKNILAIMLAVIMAMPTLFALPSTASAATYDASSLQNKILEWDLTSANVVMNSDGTGENRGSVAATTGSGTLSLICWSNGNNLWQRDGSNGIKSDDGIVWIQDLGSSLVDGKDIDIQFTMATRGSIGDSSHGVFALGSAYADAEGDSAVNDFIALDNNGSMKYNHSTEISVSTSASKPTEGTYYNYRIYFDYSTKRVNVYRDNVLIGSVQNNGISKANFKCFVVGTNITKKWTKNTIKKITISQPVVKDAGSVDMDTIGSISKQNINASTGILFNGGDSGNGQVKKNVLYPNEAGAYNNDNWRVYNHSNNDNTKISIKFAAPYSRFVFLYTGSKDDIKIPTVVRVDRNGGEIKGYAFNYIAADNSDWKLTANWYRTGGEAKYNQTNSGSVNDTSIISYDPNHNHPDYDDHNKAGRSQTTDSQTLSNMIYYNGANITDYVTNLSTPSFKISTDAYGYYDGALWGIGKWHGEWTKNETNIRLGVKSDATLPIRVINYTQLGSVIDTINGSEFQALITDVKNNSWKYTEDSIKKFYAVLARVKNFNITSSNYNYSSDVTVGSVGDEMKSIVTAFNTYKSPVKKTFTVNFTRADGTSIPSRSITAGDPLGAPPANSEVAHITSTKTHNTYTWNSTTWGRVASDLVVQDNITISETATPTDCSFTDSRHTDATAELNGYTNPKCSVCGYIDTSSRTYDPQNFKPYTDAIDEYEGITGASDYEAKYTSASRTAYENAVSAANIDMSNQTLSPTAIANAASAVAAAQSNLAIQNYTITFVKADETTVTPSLAYGTSAADVGANAPALPGAYYDDTNHYSYAWDIAFGAVTGAATYIQQKTFAPHSYDGGTHTSATTEVHGNGFTVYRCTCGREYTTYDTQDFGEYNSALTDYAATYSGAYTTSSKADYKTAVEAAEINTSDVTLSPKAISDATTAIGEAKSALDPLADLSEFDKAFDEADALLKNLAGKTAQYDADSVQALIDSVTTDKISAGTNITAKTIASANAETRADYGQAVESDADALAENIYDAINGLTLAAVDSQTSEPVDTSAFDSVVNTLNNLDPDAYEDVYDEELKDYVLESAQRIVNTAYGSETKEYDGETINVISGITSQEDADDAASRIQSALTVCTKKYAITRTGVTSFGINNGTEEGGKINYGATLTCKSGDADTAWFIEIETGSMHKKLAFQSYGSTLNTKVLGTTTVNAVKRDASNTCRVMVTRSYGAGDEREPIQYATFVPSGTVVELPAAPAIAFTTFNGYSYKDGAAISADGEGKYKITVTGDVDIVASYSENDASCAINATDISGGAHNSTVKYNEKVELDGGEGTYGWIEAVGDTYRPFYKGQKVSFLATESTTLIAVNEANFNKYGSLPCINLRKSGVIVTDSKYTFNAQLVPGSADVREYGILVAAPSSKNGYTPITPADSQIIIENSGQQQGYAVYRAKSTKLVGANQFSIAINNLPSGYKYRGYVIYHDGKSLQTVYTDVV